jgi:hypothetical protein
MAHASMLAVLRSRSFNLLDTMKISVIFLAVMSKRRLKGHWGVVHVK